MTQRFKSNLSAPDLERHFTHAAPMTTYTNCAAHTVLCDPEIFPGCGYLTHDEAAILHNIAKMYPQRWLDIGSHTGWSGAHIATALRSNGKIDMLEPEYAAASYNNTRDPKKFLERAKENLFRCGVLSKCNLIGKKSSEFLMDVPKRGRATSYSGVLIDGEHEPPFPLEDAKMVLPRLRDTAVVVFHDALGKPVQDAARFLIENGFKWRLYKTPQFMIACWRGDVGVPLHEPDASFDWADWRRSISYPDDLWL